MTIFYIILIFLNLLRPVLWLRMWSALKIFVCAEKIYILLLGEVIISKCHIGEVSD